MSPHPFDLLIRKLELHSPLSADDRRDLRGLPHVSRELEPHGYLIREGDKPQVCAVLLAGFAYRQKATDGGLRQIVGISLPGDGLDFQNLWFEAADHNVQALTPIEIATIARDDLRALMKERPAIAQAIMIDTMIDASIFREWILNVGRRDARARTAHLLCEFAMRLSAMGLSDDYAYELPMTQEQLADALGLTPVHVNRTLKVLTSQGLIDRDRRRIAFPDWQRLKEAAGFSERYLHLESRDARR